MGKKLIPLRLDEHLMVAEHIRIAREHLYAAALICNGRFRQTTTVLLYRLAQMEALRSKLDEEYHGVVSYEQFKAHGHIYYK